MALLLLLMFCGRLDMHINRFLGLVGSVCQGILVAIAIFNICINSRLVHLFIRWQVCSSLSIDMCHLLKVFQDNSLLNVSN